MESTTTTTPPAAELSSPKAGANKRQRKAALPLGDVTNLLPETPTPRNPSTRRRPLQLPSDSSASTSSSASATPVSKAPSAAVVEDERSSVKSAISTVYARRKTGTKNPISDNATCSGTASCLPLGKAARINKKTSEAQYTLPVSSSVPCHQVKKKRQTMMEKLSSVEPILTEDFVKKQRAYFDEVDSFKLQEEEASEADLE